MKKTLARLNDHFLKDSKFIYGEEISVADLQALCELTQSWMADKRFEDDYPNLKRWVADCQRELGEPFHEAHKFVYHARDTKMFGDRKPELNVKLEICTMHSNFCSDAHVVYAVSCNLLPLAIYHSQCW